METALRCASCDTPICPGCAQDAPIGMRCPSCAAPDGSGGLRRRPEQVRAAVAWAVGGAVLGGGVLGVLDGTIRLFPLLTAFIVGMVIGGRVKAAASGNTVDVVRWTATAGGAGAAVVAEVVQMAAFGGSLDLGGWTLLRIAVAGFAAWNASG